jgi:isoamyl acetate esterase
MGPWHLALHQPAGTKSCEQKNIIAAEYSSNLEGQHMQNPVMNTWHLGRYLFLLAGLLAGCAASQHFLHSRERIVFLGDSITQLGVKPNGYVTLIQDSLQKEHQGMNIEVIGAGVSGNKVPDLQKRLRRDVLDKHPTVVVIYIGINDVWHWVTPGLKGTTKEDFESGLKDIIALIHNAGARVVLCTPSVIGEKNDGTNPQDTMLVEYSKVSRRVASETGSTLCDLHGAFVAYLKTHNLSNEEKGVLTVDRVHLNDEGNRFVAAQILKTLDQ